MSTPFATAGSVRRVTAILVLALAACGGKDGGGPPGGDGVMPPESFTGEPAPEPGVLGTTETGIDLSAYEIQGYVDGVGGTIAHPGGFSLVTPANTTLAGFSAGIGKVADPPETDPSWTVVGDWYEVALSTHDLALPPFAQEPFRLTLAATVPAAAEGHPGLQFLADVGDGLQVPIDGTWDPATGTFSAAVLGLPATCRVALAFNPDVQALASDDGSVPILQAPGVPGTPWTIVEWILLYDGKKITATQAKKLLGFAKKAAQAYSAIGFKEPFLYKYPSGPKRYWPLHLTAKGSMYDGSHNTKAALRADRFGRQYMSVGRIDAPATDKLGSGYASVAHELFHAIFESYKVPFLCEDYVENGKTWCYPSTIGFNEGMATSAGYYLDQGVAKPRPSETPTAVSSWLGAFDHGNIDWSYRNQDFYVHLLRIGGLEAFRTHLEALALAQVNGIASWTGLMGRYSAALDQSATGFGSDFTGVFALYVADRAVIRTPEGHIWPAEPSGAPPGQTYAIDPDLFGASHVRVVKKADCTQDGGLRKCTALLTGQFPLAGFVFGMHVPTLFDDKFGSQQLTGTFRVISSTGRGGSVAFGFRNDRGSEEATVRALNGEPARLVGVGKDYPAVYVTAVAGRGGDPKVILEATFEGEDEPVVEPTPDVAQDVDPGEGWRDPSTGLLWQNPAADSPDGTGLYLWHDAKQYCDGLGGAWKLPTIGELRTLLRGCAATVSNGTCHVSDDCLQSGCLLGGNCSGPCMSGQGPGNFGCYIDAALQGSCTVYWSGSTVENDEPAAFYVDFQYGSLDRDQKDMTRHRVRCVHP